MNKLQFSTLFFALLLSLAAAAQSKGITNTSESKHSALQSTDLQSVKWTGGFWGERFDVFKGDMIMGMWKTFNDPDISHSYRNFEIAAGYYKGVHQGPPFHDGDFYKWFEGMATVYAITNDAELDKLMDKIIATITKVQRADGYIHTPVIIHEMNLGIDTHAKQTIVTGTKVGDKDDSAFGNRLNFETYNLGHFMTAAVIHHRATGKNTLLDAAIKATDFLCHFYETASADLARNAICPSHYMGVVEMYRTTRNERYLELSKNLINIRGMVENGTDDNQDRVPFREQYKAMGHAVRANYLYAGVADVYAETGEEQLMKNLESIWTDIVNRKMYVTGACGALYDGTSPDGTFYTPDSIQKVHQSFGRAFQLPNTTAHNETCANIGNLLFNWRMFKVTGDAKYADLVETVMYNSVLSGVSLDGKRFFYTNPLRIAKDFPYTLRWSKEREEYIKICNCCPPNTVRTLCQAQNYAYSIGNAAIYCNMYGSSDAEIELDKKNKIKLKQISNYPWDGDVKINIESTNIKTETSLMLRIPEWCTEATVWVNGAQQNVIVEPNSFVELKRRWKKSDVVELKMDMRVRLLESNPLVEETRNQTVVKRGPLVYCLEGLDVAGGVSVDDVLIPADIKFTPRKTMIDGSEITVLDGIARLVENKEDWTNTLYREVTPANKSVKISLVPYYAWGNRGKTEMTVWMPLVK